MSDTLKLNPGSAQWYRARAEEEKNMGKQVTLYNHYIGIAQAVESNTIDLERENAVMREAIKEAHEAFKRTEFIEDVDGLYCCPDCLNYEQYGHKPNCGHAAALAKLQPFLDQ